jgi:hypothetical protein
MFHLIFTFVHAYIFQVNGQQKLLKLEMLQIKSKLLTNTTKEGVDILHNISAQALIHVLL